MTDPTELARRIRNTVRNQYISKRRRVFASNSDPLDAVTMEGKVDLIAVADDLIAAGYRKPERVITTVEELMPLAFGSLLLTTTGPGRVPSLWSFDPDAPSLTELGFSEMGSHFRGPDMYAALPATVVWEPVTGWTSSNG